METKVNYPLFWLGLSKIGVSTALINTSLRRDLLIQSIKSVNSKAIIVSTELADAIGDIRNHPDIKGLPIFQYNTKYEYKFFLPGAIGFRQELESMPTMFNVFVETPFNPHQVLLYICTTDFMGLPKTIAITHGRMLRLSMYFSTMLNIRPNDTIYNPVALTHAAPEAIAIGSLFTIGTTIVLRSSFSASDYVMDCIKYNATIGIYMGDMCRFMLGSPVTRDDTAHNVRLLIGNGLKGHIWQQFQSRFKLPQIAEFYKSNEGNVVLSKFRQDS